MKRTDPDTSEGTMTTPRLFIIPDVSVPSNAKRESYSSTIITLAHPKAGKSLENHVDLRRFYAIFGSRFTDSFDYTDIYASFKTIRLRRRLSHIRYSVKAIV
jgi:hypothetical protein